MKKITLALLLSFCAVLVNSCKDDDDDGDGTPQSVVGNWDADSNDYGLEFNQNGTYEMTSYSTTLESGTYTTSGNSLTITATSSSTCSAPNLTGSYTFSVTSSGSSGITIKTITFTKMTDACVFRSGVFTMRDFTTF